MKKLLLVILLLFLPSRSHAALAFAQSVLAVTSGSSITTADITTQATNSLFVCNLGWYASFTSLTDSKSNTYSESVGAVTDPESSGNQQLKQMYKEGGAGGANHNFTLQGDFYLSIVCVEVTGAETTAALDQA